MSTAKVMLWGSYIGAVTWDNTQEQGVFEYTPSFQQLGIEISPIVMPTSKSIYTFGLNKTTFKGLPGMLADCLPDKFGNALINAWCASTGISPHSFNPVDRLLYIGNRAMGALEFEPASTQSLTRHDEPIDIAEMVELASQALGEKEAFQSYLGHENATNREISNILKIGTSAGGARAKAIIAWDRSTGEVRSGQLKTNSNFEPWLIKFDGVNANSDKELNDPKGYGRIEYAYYLMAKDCGIEMSECRLLEENGRAHFMTKRFDRLASGEKLHMQSLCGIAHYDFNNAGATSYEDAFSVIKKLQGHSALALDKEQLFTRAVFNIMAMNRDDHTKQISFLMDKEGKWTLAPAYDITYSYNPQGQWTSKHQMSLNGKRNNIKRDDLLTLATKQSISKAKANRIISTIADIISAWPSYADQASVTDQHTTKINNALRPNHYLAFTSSIVSAAKKV